MNALARSRHAALRSSLFALVLLGGSASTAGVSAQQPASAGDLEAIQVRPNVFMIAGAGGNITAHVGPDGVILVDTGVANMSEKILAAVKTLSSKPIRYIINTSSDADHVGGNESLSKAGQTIISGIIGNPGLTEDNLTNSGAAGVLAQENVLTRMSAPTGKQSPFPAGSWPTKSYIGKGYSMYLNGEGIQVLHQPAAHSDGDSIVFLRRADVISTGDVVDLRHFPVIDVGNGGSVQGEIDALNRLLEMVIPPFPLVWQESRTLVIPGHGRIIDHSDLVEYRDMVVIMRDRIQDLIGKGMTLQQIKAADATKGFAKRWGSNSGAWTTDMFVEAVYKSLTAKKQS